MTTSEHWFGLKPNVTPLPDLYWGCQAIYFPYDGIQFVWNRCQFNDTSDSEDELRETLITWATGTGLEKLRKELKRLRLEARDNVLVTVTHRSYTMIANPNRSHGYLYIGAWRNDTKRKDDR